MTKIKNIFLAGLLLYCAFSFKTKGQEIQQSARDSIFMSALHDELRRSMENLEDTGSGKPCFISYSLLNGVLTNSEAVLGALTGSSSMDVGDWYLRLMMGSYDRNDENFIDPLAGPDGQNQFEMVCPVEPDYWSVRKAFWWNTDNIFRSAVKSYKNKISAIREFPLDAETSTLPDYTKAPAVKLSYPGSIVVFPRQQTDGLVKELSAIFRDVKGIHKSEVSLTALSSTVYTVNSEGTDIRIPLNLCLINIMVQVKTERNRCSVIISASWLPGIFLPPVDSMKQAALRLANTC
jgi:hypothetical protein